MHMQNVTYSYVSVDVRTTALKSGLLQTRSICFECGWSDLEVVTSLRSTSRDKNSRVYYNQLPCWGGCACFTNNHILFLFIMWIRDAQNAQTRSSFWFVLPERSVSIAQIELNLIIYTMRLILSKWWVGYLEGGQWTWFAIDFCARFEFLFVRLG